MPDPSRTGTASERGIGQRDIDLPSRPDRGQMLSQQREVVRQQQQAPSIVRNIDIENVQRYVTDDSGRVVGVVHEPTFYTSPLLAGLSALTGITPSVYTGDTRYDPFDLSRKFGSANRGGRPQQVAPAQDPMTGQARCPEGYVFNETLQACIMDTSATSPIASMPPSYTPPSGGYYARQGLLDQPPAGLLEAGFGSPQDFAAANTAFRMGAATRPDIYSDPYNLQGYTLLS
jgi:hypothetical protein